jgi:carbon storage regulator
MLVLSRKLNESLVIDGRITVTVLRTEGDVVKLGIEAPLDVPVHRQEVYEEIQGNNQAALTKKRPAVPRLPARTAVSSRISRKPESLPSLVSVQP